MVFCTAVSLANRRRWAWLKEAPDTRWYNVQPSILNHFFMYALHTWSQFLNAHVWQKQSCEWGGYTAKYYSTSQPKISLVCRVLVQWVTSRTLHASLLRDPGLVLIPKQSWHIAYSFSLNFSERLSLWQGPAPDAWQARCDSPKGAVMAYSWSKVVFTQLTSIFLEIWLYWHLTLHYVLADWNHLLWPTRWIGWWKGERCLFQIRDWRKGSEGRNSTWKGELCSERYQISTLLNGPKWWANAICSLFAIIQDGTFAAGPYPIRTDTMCAPANRNSVFYGEEPPASALTHKIVEPDRQDSEMRSNCA